MSFIIDSHCHLGFEDYASELDAVLARARAAGLGAMVCVGSGRAVTEAAAAVALAEREPDIWAVVGMHPHDARLITAADWTALEAMARHPRVVAVGETGLDYHYNLSPVPEQQAAFRRFVALARAAARPVVSHVREAHDDAVAILSAEGAQDTGGVIHCFTGGVEDARRYLDLGQHLSFSGILTFRNAGDIRAAAAFAPSDRILVETDAPYLAPMPHRGRRNEPAFVVHTLEALAALRATSVEEMARLTAANTSRLFGLPLSL